MNGVGFETGLGAAPLVAMRRYGVKNQLQSRRPGRAEASRRLFWGLYLCLYGLSAPVALAEPSVTQLAWQHPEPAAVEHFEILMAFSPEEKLNPAPIPVGKPLQGDHFAWGVTLDDQTSVWVAVVAVGKNGKRSSPTPWRRIDWQPGQAPLTAPGRPYLVDPPN